MSRLLCRLIGCWPDAYCERVAPYTYRFWCRWCGRYFVEGVE